jgi:cytochrome c peroxidase
MKRVLLVGLGCLVVATAVSACSKKPEEAPAPAASAPAASASAGGAAGEIDPTTLAAFARLPQVMESSDNPITDDKVALGRALFYDTRLSAAKDISCNTCHLLDKGGVDGEKVSTGHKGQAGRRNSPTVYNAAGHLMQFWDGRAKSIEDQAKGPLMNPVEMAMTGEKSVVAELGRVKWYREQFAKAFPAEKEPLTLDNIAKAIGAFERKLVTPSRWDKYLAGDKSALTQAEKDGWKTFSTTGCPACHNGAYVGGVMYQKLGLVKPWSSESDLGRYEVTKADADKMFFKVPSLRNIERTAPYFHDGSVVSLPEAIKLMARHQLGKELGDAEIASIATWLKTLSGDVPTEYIAPASIPVEARSPVSAPAKR